MDAKERFTTTPISEEWIKGPPLIKEGTKEHDLCGVVYMFVPRQCKSNGIPGQVNLLRINHVHGEPLILSVFVKQLGLLYGDHK